MSSLCVQKDRPIGQIVVEINDELEIDPRLKARILAVAWRRRVGTLFQKEKNKWTRHSAGLYHTAPSISADIGSSAEAAPLKISNSFLRGSKQQYAAL